MIDRSLLLAAVLALSSFAAPVWADADPDDDSEDLPPPVEAPVAPPPPPPEPVAEPAPVESAPVVEEAPAPVAEEPGRKAYVGLDYVRGDLNSSVEGECCSTLRNTFEFDMLRVRAGLRLFEFLAAELQAGTGLSSDDGEAEMDYYIGAFMVPNAVLFDTFELSFPVGVAKLEISQGKRTFDDMDLAYGFQADLPLKLFADVPDLRLGGGFMVYHQGEATRTYGFNLGLRYDFDTADFEIVNPITAVRDLFGGGDSESNSPSE